MLQKKKRNPPSFNQPLRNTDLQITQLSWRKERLPDLNHRCGLAIHILPRCDHGVTRVCGMGVRDHGFADRGKEVRCSHPKRARAPLTITRQASEGGREQPTGRNSRVRNTIILRPPIVALTKGQPKANSGDRTAPLFGFRWWHSAKKKRHSLGRF